jgi:hypothetical protein
MPAAGASGFTIQTEACREYMRSYFVEGSRRQMDESLAKLEALQGQKLGRATIRRW